MRTWFPELHRKCNISPRKKESILVVFQPWKHIGIIWYILMNPFSVKNNGLEKFIFILFLITCNCQRLFCSNITASMTWVQKTVASYVFSNRDEGTVRISVFSSKLPREWQVTNHCGQEEMKVYMSTVFALRFWRWRNPLKLYIHV